MVRSVIFNKIYVYGKKKKKAQRRTLSNLFKSVNLVINFHIFHCIKN